MSFKSPFTLLRNLFAAVLHLWHRLLYTLARWIRKDTATYVTLDLQEEYPFGPPDGLAKWFQQDLSWMELRDFLVAIRDSPDIDGLVIRTDGLQLGMGRAASVRDLLDEVREADTHVVAFLEGATTTEYMLATAADDILMPPVDSMFTFGPRFDQTFVKSVLDEWDVDPQFIHLGEFKTATHPAIHDEMTVPQRSMMQQLYDRLLDELTSRIGQRRSIDADAAGDLLFGEAPSDARDAVRANLIDHGVFYDRIRPWLLRGDAIPAIARHDGVQPEDDEASDFSATQQAPVPASTEGVDFVDVDNADALMKPEFEWRPVVTSTPEIAVVNLSGPIVESADDLPVQQSSIIDPDDVVPALQQLRDDPNVEGVIAHINSPGGSATASDVIWQSMVDLADTKPLAAYCTDVAASGGYYLASAADHITCHATTMTGSIGVVLGKISAQNLPDRIGANVESIHNHEADTFTSLVHPLGPDMMDRLNEQGRSFYRRFLERVGQARDISRRRLHRYARGRVYFGRDAADRSLIDSVGGFDDAYDWVTRQTEPSRDALQLSYVEHRQRGISDLAGIPGLTQTLASLRKYLQSDTVSIIDRITDTSATDAYRPTELSPALTAALLQREHLLALAPVQLDWPTLS